ncbi:PAAR domain-containing protein [Sphingomonas radiodurans]|uniref:PAAR domain-containing protein n=1 Tax=Sphingomonas radiodurans TaxID=2890321 RepID=UPI001E418369|nr:PAAR domain-containing protein [Sphingomonas radiodurans]WBH16704.1 PAAR domain-containing protein [Sphingomonas radiodurans]
MGAPASRLTDMHVCPMVTGVVPHVGGPVSGPCAPTVLIGGLPAARIGDMCVCVGPPDVILVASMTVITLGSAQARIGDTTAHGGKLILGMPTVLVGG